MRSSASMGTISPRPMLLPPVVGPMSCSTSRDFTVIREKLAIINDAEQVKADLNDERNAIRAREKAVTAREDAVAADHTGFNHDVAQEVLRRITDLEVRFAQTRG